MTEAEPVGHTTCKEPGPSIVMLPAMLCKERFSCVCLCVCVCGGGGGGGKIDIKMVGTCHLTDQIETQAYKNLTCRDTNSLGKESQKTDRRNQNFPQKLILKVRFPQK